MKTSHSLRWYGVVVVLVIVQLIVVIDRWLIKLPLDAAADSLVVLANELVVAFVQVGHQQPGHSVAVSLTSSSRWQCEKAADSDEQPASEYTSDETAQFALHHGRVCPDQVRLDQVQEQLLCAQ